MPIKSFKLANFRKFHEINLEFSEQINFLIGKNASGKTSILEAIYLLSCGRSFRTSNLANLVKLENLSNLSNSGNAIPINIWAKITQDNNLQSLISYSRNSNTGKKKILLNEKPLNSLAEIARLLPVCIIDGEGFKGVSAPPQQRRQLFDWGMFHVKHEFYPIWRKYTKALDQRNSLIRSSKLSYNFNDFKQFLPWDNMLAEAALELITLRQQYFNIIAEKFYYYINKLNNPLNSSLNNNIQIELNSGLGDAATIIPTIQEIKLALNRNLKKDLLKGYTSIGPHRADIVFKIDGQPAKELVSSGQEKVIMIAFYLALIDIIKELTGKKCTILIDDIAAELDNTSKNLLCEQLFNSGHQLIMTAIRESDLPLELFNLNNNVINNSFKMFHVEHFSFEYGTEYGTEYSKYLAAEHIKDIKNEKEMV
ncbi:MAG: DNA replication/repair protein RecF [Gammaproteobacteria bacterium]|nr:DNA replication/repair protein RecF [Gammaproteobacteria bacterium]